MTAKKSGKPAKKSTPKKATKKDSSKKKSSRKRTDDEDMDDEDIMEEDKLMIEEEEEIEFKPGDEEEFDLDEDLGNFDSYDDDDDDDF